MLVSVIIITRNRPQLLCDCLRHLLAQGCKSFEVIVVDSSSGGRTWEIITSEFPQVRYVHLPRSKNKMPQARNLGLRHARGEIIAFIDDDSMVQPGWLAALVPVGVKIRLLGALHERGYTVDWPGTLAYMPTIESQAINVNLKGREPHGIVGPADYEPLRDEISTRLLELADPHTDWPVVECVLKREEVYQGPYVDHAPDLLVRFHEECYLAVPALSPVEVFSKEGMAYHRQAGILIARGPGIRPQQHQDGAHIFDLAPTILHLLSVPVPADCDGRVLTELFVPGSDPAERPARYQPPVPPTPDDLDFTHSEAKEIEERLRNLGYLE